MSVSAVSLNDLRFQFFRVAPSGSPRQQGAQLVLDPFIITGRTDAQIVVVDHVDSFVSLYRQGLG